MSVLFLPIYDLEAKTIEKLSRTMEELELFRASKRAIILEKVPKLEKNVIKKTQVKAVSVANSPRVLNIITSTQESNRIKKAVSFVQKSIIKPRLGDSYDLYRHSVAAVYQGRTCAKSLEAFSYECGVNLGQLHGFSGGRFKATELVKVDNLIQAIIKAREKSVDPIFHQF